MSLRFLLVRSVRRSNFLACFHAKHCFLEAVAFALDAIHQAARPHEFRGEQAQAEENGEPTRARSDNHDCADEQESETGNDAEGAANLVESWLKHDRSTNRCIEDGRRNGGRQVGQIHLLCAGRGTKMRDNSFHAIHADFLEVFMRVGKKLQAIGMILGMTIAASAEAQHIGKYVPVAAGSDADHAMREITAATDPAEKLALIDKFASGLGQGDLQIVTDELYVNYYLAQKNYPKTYEYGEKLFAIDADNFANALSMIRAASESNDTDKLLFYGEKTSGILQRYNASAAPSGTSEDQWKQEKQTALQANA